MKQTIFNSIQCAHHKLLKPKKEFKIKCLDAEKEEKD